MSEKLYRRNEDGMMVEAAPEARAKAAAHDSYFAKAGRLGRHSKRYVSGKFKGKTYDEAKQEFEDKWAEAPGAVKDKYAKKGDYDLAPLERKRQGIPGLPGQEGPPPVTNASLNNNPRIIAKRKANLASAVDAANAEKAKARKVGNGTPVSPERKAAAEQAAASKPAETFGTSFSELTAKPVAPADGVKSVGDGSSAENGWTPQPGARPEVNQPATPKKSFAESTFGNSLGNTFGGKATEGAGRGTPVSPAAKANQTPLEPGAREYLEKIANQGGKVIPDPPADTSTPIGRALKGVGNSLSNAVDSAAAAVQWPFVSDAENAQAQKSNAATVAAQNQAKADSEKRRAADVAKVTGKPAPAAVPVATPSSRLPGTEVGIPPMIARPKQTIASVAPTGKNLMSAEDAAKAGAAVGGRVSRLTGLPFGYQPGDALPVGADAAMVNRADASRARQAAAQAAADAAKPIPKATLAPVRVRYADAQRQYQKDLDPAKSRAANDIYMSGTDLEKARMGGDILRQSAGIETINDATPRAKVVSEAPRTSTNAVPMPQRAKIPGVQKPRFALARR